MVLRRRLFTIKPTIDTRRPAHFTPHHRRSLRPASAGLTGSRRSLSRSKNFYSEDQLAHSKGSVRVQHKDNIEQFFR